MRARLFKSRVMKTTARNKLGGPSDRAGAAETLLNRFNREDVTFAVDKARIAMLENGKDEPPGAVALEGLFVTPYPTPGGGNSVFSPPFLLPSCCSCGPCFGPASATG